jgi:PAS domain S-box-containing protein
VYGDTPYLAIFARVAESGLATHFETAYEPMGKVFAISVFSTGADQFATVFSDITERRRSYDALRASEQRFRALFDDLPRIAVQGYDRNRRVVYWNRASQALYGYAPEEAVGRLLEDLIIPDPMRTDVVAAVEAWTAGGRAIPAGELTLRRKDGSPVTVYSSHVMQRGANGEPEMYCIDVDLTELVGYRDQLERLVDDRTRELAKAKTLAEAASQAKSTFLANMSHELRTPMNGVLGMIGLARKRMQDPNGRQQLDKAEISARHLLGVLNDVLDLSKIEADHLRLDSTPFRLGAVLETLVTIVGDRAAEKGLRLRIDMPPGLTSRAFLGDPLRLGQILINLTGNAIKFSERDDIDLRFRIADETPSAVRLRVEVQDRGIGIGEDDRRRLFNAFEQADGTMTRRYGGTGLGLAISKRLVGMMGGEIGVETAVGQGSTFWFTVRLPVGNEPADAPAAPGTAMSADARLRREFAGVRVLLAEDEPINCEVIQFWLTEAGLLVDLAADGQQAVDMARRTPYAAILMDVQMPRLNGLDATRAIRAGTINATTPIIAMTANAFEQDRRQCLEAGMDDHVPKPAEPAQLLGKILEQLAGPRAG